jgi:hypothetical protein
LRNVACALMAAASVTRRGALVGGALVVGGVLAGRTEWAGAAAPSTTDVRILNFALRLEELERGLYSAAVGGGALRGELRGYARVVLGHEGQHVALLRQVLGAKADPAPRMRFGAAATNEKDFVGAAIALEDAVVAAYNGQAANLSPAVLAAAARIVSVEARHAAWIRAIAGKPPAQDPTDPLWTERQVDVAIEKLGFLR